MDYNGRIQPNGFFRLRLLSNNSEEILKSLEELENDSKAIENQIREVCWYSKGSVTYQDAIRMSPKERVDWIKFAADKYDKESGNETFRQELL